MSDDYIVPGMNVTKCPTCGYDKKGHINPRGGNVFIPVPLSVYERARHDGTITLEGTCQFGHTNEMEFIHPLAPKTNEDVIRELSAKLRSYFR